MAGTLLSDTAPQQTYAKPVQSVQEEPPVPEKRDAAKPKAKGKKGRKQKMARRFKKSPTPGTEISSLIGGGATAPSAPGGGMPDDGG